ICADWPPSSGTTAAGRWTTCRSRRRGHWTGAGTRRSRRSRRFSATRPWADGRPRGRADQDSARFDVCDLEPESLSQAAGDQRAVAGLRGRFDAQQRAHPVHRQAPDERLERDEVEDLLGVLADVLRGQAHAGALAHPLALVVAVLELAHLGVGCQLGVVLVADPRLGQQLLEALGVGPRVPGPAHATALADVEDLADARVVQRVDEAGGVELIDADGGDPGHPAAVARDLEVSPRPARAGPAARSPRARRPLRESAWRDRTARRTPR